MHTFTHRIAHHQRLLACVAVTVALAIAFVAALSPSIAMAKTGSFVYDQMDLLDESEFNELESQAKDYAEKYNMGVYLLTCDNMGMSDPDPDDRNNFARSFYTEHHLGVGPNKDGILFVIASVSRDYVTLKHIGTSNNDPFSNDCVKEIESNVTDYLHDDDWSGGAKAYYDTVDSQLKYYSDHGKAWRRPNTVGLLLKIAFTILLPLLITLLVIKTEKDAMKTARMQTNAGAYEGNALQLDVSRDIFTHRTHSITPKPKHNDSDSGGGWSDMGGGFSGSGGGKF
ncbi:MAG: TPM domain-containing protein [Atopobiaceae bacterium]|nr:TPM domain-containing protein [Atopobiaceae bacterium]